MIRAMTKQPPSRQLKPCALALALVAAAATAAHAGERWVPGDDVSPSYAPHSTAERRMTLQQAIERVQRSTGGRVLDARASREGYRIKVLTRGGEVRVVYVDARTGEMR
jgi:uncharacterized membrane protein YkoI